MASLAAAQLDITADQFNTEMRRLLDTNAPSTQRQVLIARDFNFHFDCPTNSNTARIMDMLQSFRFSQAVSVPTHRCGHTLDLVVCREEDALLRSVSVCHSLSSDHLPVMCSWIW